MVISVWGTELFPMMAMSLTNEYNYIDAHKSGMALGHYIYTLCREIAKNFSSGINKFQLCVCCNSNGQWINEDCNPQRKQYTVVKLAGKHITLHYAKHRMPFDSY